MLQCNPYRQLQLSSKLQLSSTEMIFSCLLHSEIFWGGTLTVQRHNKGNRDGPQCKWNNIFYWRGRTSFVLGGTLLWNLKYVNCCRKRPEGCEGELERKRSLFLHSRPMSSWFETIYVSKNCTSFHVANKKKVQNQKYGVCHFYSTPIDVETETGV